MTTETISVSLQKEIISTAQKAVYSIIKNRLRNTFSTGEVEDVIGNTILKACRSIHRYDSSRSLFSWIYKIAENCAKDELSGKLNRFNPSADEIDETAALEKAGRFASYNGTEFDADRDLRTMEMQEEIQVEVDKMPQIDRDIYSLIDQDLSVKDIAKTLGSTSNVISIRKCRMMKNLQKTFTERGVKVGRRAA